jgi:hypothetical protein
MAGAGRGGKTVPLGNQEPIGRNAERGVVVKPSPVATFKVSQPQLLLQLLVIPFDDPAVFGHLDQCWELNRRRQRGYPVFGRFFLPSRPFDQQPLLGVRFGFFIIAMGWTYANGGKAGPQFPAGPSRQVISLKTVAGRLIANCFTDTG